jgi:type I site-specific restriction endonuclease
MMAMQYYLCKEGRKKKIIFLANTVQLVKQQTDAIRRDLPLIG